MLQPTLVDLPLLVQDLGRMLRRLVPESIELEVEREEGPGLVRGDRIRPWIASRKHVNFVWLLLAAELWARHWLEGGGGEGLRAEG